MKRFKKTRLGQGLVEYVLLAALIALVSIAALTSMGQTVNEGLFSNISSNLDTANTNIQSSP
ncbi:MAG: Flp/Fap pilin component [Clostridiales bacterium]|jgi:Flp pilus assembly pilin Flp|nr:Flp/Fap pilin component [Clostridiales bacterium]MDN5283278.1 Flp/Fap pilin component [Candidatus Ozemobacter sp.]